ncbi:MAG: 4-hydroxy-tetrahydrodipicolinate synthase [Candidatus Thorarchaeota archaeon]|nr:4-hydroxy-tetrahydrodipicolinate synthase [Candidatus Thorarchaeota archaeon]
MTKRFVPKGVMPALVTPFTRDGDLIENSLKTIIDYTIEKGATGLVPAGTTGEFVYMRTEERKKLLRLAVEYADGRVPVVAGTGQNSTRATVELTKYAADIGCQAALVISPFYLRPGDKGYYEHYETVARKSDLPIILYNIPQCTLGVLNSSLVEDLAELDNIVGIKDSSGVIGYTLELIQKLNGKIPLLIGHDECFLSAVAAGAEAAILASANIIPHIWLEIMEKVKKGDIDGAANLQHSVQTLSRIVTRNGGAPPVKAAFKMMGVKVGKSRMPLDTGGTLTVELKDEIRIELEKLGLVDSFSSTELTKDVDIEKILQEQGYSTDPDMKTETSFNKTVAVSIAVGPKSGALGRAFVGMLTTPKVGHEALTVILEPNLSVRPSSIMLPLRQITSMRQASFFYGSVQSGAAKAFAHMIGTGKIPEDSLNNDVAILALDIELNTRDRRAVTKDTEKAVTNALEKIWR